MNSAMTWVQAGPTSAAARRHQVGFAQGEGDLLRRVALEVGGPSPRMSDVGGHDVTVVHDLHDVTASAGMDLLAHQPPWHRVERLADLDVAVGGDLARRPHGKLELIVRQR
jgi:hypothetical protein